MQTEELAFWEKQFETLTILKARDKSPEWDAQLAEAEAEIERLTPKSPTPKRNTLTKTDIAMLAKGFAPAIHQFVLEQLAPVLARVNALEAQQRDGKPADPK